MAELKEDGLYNEWFEDDSDETLIEEDEDNQKKNFWLMISPQIYIPRELYDKFSVVYTLGSISNNGILWKDIEGLIGQHRFRRPIDETDFWTFEYDIDNRVWRPYPLSINRHFPDVYIANDPANEVPKLNKIYKTFFFYSDTMNVLNDRDDIVNATPNWDKDMEEYEYDRSAIYRDIFMEKFYWMGVRAIYKGLVVTNNRWEIIEYVINNNSYERFNELFLQTMDPYFKMGLATYLKSSNYEFPFDDAIDKMNEAINQNWLGYKRITNFELYLNKTWIPSYFDYIVKIMDEWKPGDRLLRRPRSSFDIIRLHPFLVNIQNNISIAVGTVTTTLEWIIHKLEAELYNLNIQNIFDIRDKSVEMFDNIKSVYKYTLELDMDIYGIEDINHIIDCLHHHMKLTDDIERLFEMSREDVATNNVYIYKQEILDQVSDSIKLLNDYILITAGMVQNFDMEEFMRSVNDLYTYFEHDKDNPDDRSLIGYINKFNDPWSVKVKELRNILFQSTSIMYGKFEPAKCYTNEEIIEFTNSVKTVKTDLQNFNDAVTEFWTNKGYEKDQNVIDKLDYVATLLGNLRINLEDYMHARRNLIDEINKIMSLLQNMFTYNISNTEKEYYKIIDKSLDAVILDLSYIAGTNKKDDAIIHFQEFKNELVKWNSFISIEGEVFTKLTEFTAALDSFNNTFNESKNSVNDVLNNVKTVNETNNMINGKLLESLQKELTEITNGFELMKSMNYNFKEEIMNTPLQLNSSIEVLCQNILKFGIL